MFGHIKNLEHILRKGYGLGAQAMAGGSFKAPLFCVSWPTGEFGGMGLEGAVRLGYRKELEAEPSFVEDMVAATRRGYNFTVTEPRQALGDILAANPTLEREDVAAQLKFLLPALHPDPFKESVLREWSAWASSHGLLPKPLDTEELNRDFAILHAEGG